MLMDMFRGLRVVFQQLCNANKGWFAVLDSHCLLYIVILLLLVRVGCAAAALKVCEHLMRPCMWYLCENACMTFVACTRVLCSACQSMAGEERCWLAFACLA